MSNEQHAYTEAPFSSSFYMFHGNGLNILLTIRDEQYQRGVERMNEAIEMLIKNGYTYEGMPGEETRAKSQDCYGFQIIKKTDKDGKSKITVELPFLLNNGESADYPKTLSTAVAVEQFMKALTNQGVDTHSLANGELYKMPIRVTWKQGKEIPNSNPVKHFTDWLGFEVLDKSNINRQKNQLSYADLLKSNPHFDTREIAASFCNHWLDLKLTESEIFAALDIEKFSQWKGDFLEADQACVIAHRNKFEPVKDEIPF